ncbi:glycosyltransferase [Pantanalinema sp. GBBB05]|uniref:glycosyltransferase n=1 Tax=Pantanalinema sp. GBBB05 TaxID=2604139 RepID=UPI003D813988
MTVAPVDIKVKAIRLVIVQYAGDYRETVLRFMNGEQETYYAQRYSVDAVAKIAQRVEAATVICGITDEFYDEVLPNGVRAIGAGFRHTLNMKRLLALIEQQNPTHLLIRTPISQIIQWAKKQNVRVAMTLADSFDTKGIRNKVDNFILASALNSDQVDWVGNHGINSSLSLAKIGVEPKKIVPWDWPSAVTPKDFAKKSFPHKADAWNLLYVGSVIEAKGAGDVIEAIAKLKAFKQPIKLKIAGKGDIEQFSQKVKQLNLEEQVEFLGMVPHQKVIQLLREADLAVVPSRHEYPEGLPMTIYETLCVRTPLIASDHPMFQDILKHGFNSMVFTAGDAVELATCIQALMVDSALYEKISLEAEHTWHKLQIPVKWADLIDAWLFSSSKNQQWLLENNLSSYLQKAITA